MEKEMNGYEEAVQRIGAARIRNSKILDLSDLGLTSLPENIGQLTALQFLDLSDNQLTNLPESLRQLTALKHLSLHGNSRLGIPREILGPTWSELREQSEKFFQELSLTNIWLPYPGKPEAKDDFVTPKSILDYYFKNCLGKRPLNEAKLILVGRGGVGKTSLVNRLVENRFERDSRKPKASRSPAGMSRFRAKTALYASMSGISAGRKSCTPRISFF